MAAIAAVGVYWQLIVGERNAREVDGSTATISYPEENASVPYRVRVAGTSDDVPDEVDPWLFVQANDGDLYPQGGDDGNNVKIDRSDGAWCGYAYFGEANRRAAGREYSLILALPTNNEVDEKLEDKMQAAGVLHWRNLPGGFDRLAAVGNLARTRVVPTEAQLSATPDCR